MNLKNVLSKDFVAIDLQAKDKLAVIDALLELLDRSGKIKDFAKAKSAVLERERKMSTGMKHGIAIPHGKCDAVDELIACIGISRSPVDFDSLDGEPCRIFIMTISPAEKTGPHLKFLAEVSSLFKSAEKREALLAAKTREEIVRILVE